MSGDSQDKSNPNRPAGEEKIADSINENDPHKVEKLANAGKDTDVAEDSE